MCLQVVHDHDLARVDTVREDLFNVQFKGRRVGRSFQNQRGSHAVEGKRGNACCMPATVTRNASSGSFSLWRSCIQGRERTIETTRIAKDQIFCRKLARV